MSQFKTDHHYVTKSSLDDWLAEHRDLIVANLERLGAGDLVEMVAGVAA